MKCQARIIKRYKTTRAECVWPKYPNFKNLPKCDGDIAVIIKAVDEAVWGDTYARLKIDFECSNCKHGYIEGMNSINESLWNNKITLQQILDALNIKTQ